MGGAMRALDCDCGQHLEANDDAGLFEKARAHVDQVHPDMDLDDDHVKALIAERGYDK